MQKQLQCQYSLSKSKLFAYISYLLIEYVNLQLTCLKVIYLVLTNRLFTILYKQIVSYILHYSLYSAYPLLIKVKYILDQCLLLQLIQLLQFRLLIAFQEGSSILVLEDALRDTKGYNNVSFTSVIIFDYSLDSKL